MSETKQHDYQRRIGGLDRPEPDGSEDAWDDTTDTLIEAAHGLLCNVDGPAQGWAQSDEWVEAADRWLARYDRVQRDHATVYGIVLRDQTAGALGLCGPAPTWDVAGDNLADAATWILRAHDGDVKAETRDWERLAQTIQRWHATRRAS